MSWTTRLVIEGSSGFVHIQVAASSAALDATNELGFVTAYSFGQEAEVAEKGPYINSAQKKKTLTSYNASGSITVDVAAGADTVRNLFFTAMSAKSRLKITLIIGTVANGEKHVFDQAIVGVEGEADPAEGSSYTFAFDADSYVHTPGTGT